MAGRVFYVNVEKEEWKLDTLCDLCEFLPTPKSVIFVNTRSKVDWLADKMRGRDNTVSVTHGDMKEKTRDAIMAEFIAGSSHLLITTDDAFAPGSLHVHQVPLVVNYDLPIQPENFLYRIGRSSSFWTTGLAINFVTREDKRMFFDIKRFNNMVIEELPANIVSGNRPIDQSALCCLVSFFPSGTGTQCFNFRPEVLLFERGFNLEIDALTYLSFLPFISVIITTAVE